MKRAPVLLVCALLFALTSCAMHSRAPVRAERHANEQAARATALEWLELLDAGDYAEAYEREPSRVRAAGTDRQFIRSMRARRAPFGSITSRKLIGAAFAHKMPGAPDGNYESILFRTSFEHKAVTAERVILSNESGQWRVTDYRVY